MACPLLLWKVPSEGPALVGGRGKPASGSALAPLTPRPARSAARGDPARVAGGLAGPALRGPAPPLRRWLPAPGSASASSASLFPAPRLALGRRIRVFSGGGRTAVRTGLLAACSRPGMAPRRRHLCFFRPANPTFRPGPSPPAPRRRPGPLPGSLGSPAGRLAGPAAAPRARHAPQTAPRTAGAPAHFPFAGGWLCGAGAPRCGKPLVAKLSPGATGDPAPGPRRGPPVRRSGPKAAATNTRRPEPGDSQPGRAGTGGRGRSPGVRSPLRGHPATRPPAPLPSLCPWGPQANFPWKSWKGTFKLCPFPLLCRLSPSAPPDLCIQSLS